MKKTILLFFVSVIIGSLTVQAQTELITNGDFETGDLTGWTASQSGSHFGWNINDGIIPTWATGIVAPLSGNYDVFTSQSGPGIAMISNPIVVPQTVVSANFSWVDRIFNYGVVFSDPNQEFRVSILHGVDPPVQIFSTNPGDPVSQPGPNPRSFDLTTLLQSLQGEIIQIQFTQQDNLGNFEVFVDDVSLLVESCPADIVVDNDPGVCGAVVNYTLPPGPPSTLPGFTPLGIYGGNTYFISNGTFTGPAAFADALANGGHVTSINSGAENAFVRNAATSAAGGVNIYIGINDVASEGNFVWQSGEPVVYTNWNGGEPNNAGNEDHTLMFTNGLWNDVPSNFYSLRYVLKLAGSVQQIAGLPSGSTFPVGTTSNEFLITDASGETIICSSTVTVNDTEDPVISCPDTEDGYDTDSGECTAELSFEATATDNCSATVAYFIGNDPLTFPHDFPFGITTVTAKATDPSGNTDECTFDVNVDNVITVTSVSVNPDEQQYSDLVTFTATIAPYECDGAGTAAQSVDFYIGNEFMGNAALVNGVATLENVPLVESSFTPDCFTDGELAPGGKTVTADFVGVDTDFTVVDPTTSLTITQEDISVWYTGTDIAATVSVGSSAFSVTLRAVVKDDSDINTGDVRNAKVRFLNGGILGSPIVTGDTDGDGWICITLLDASDKTEGLAETIWEGQISQNPDQFDIAVEVDGYYDGMSQEYPLIIYEPEGDFITGGGWQEIPESGAGFYAADVGSKMNFGFNVKFNKKGTNLQGKMNIIYRAGSTVYQIKSNATTSLGTDLSVEGELKAEFVSKANLTDVTDPENPVGISGNLTLHVRMTDKGEPGSGDMIAFTLYDGDPNALWFSNNWVFPNTEELVINGGNLVVHSGAGGDRGKGKKEGIISVDGSGPISHFNVYPNPFSERAYIEFSAATDSRAKLDIFDVTGKKLSTLIDQNVNAGEEYRLEYEPGTIANGILFYTLTIDNEVKTGKLIYRR
jgi:hypothetical protein